MAFKSKWLAILPKLDSIRPRMRSSLLVIVSILILLYTTLHWYLAQFDSSQQHLFKGPTRGLVEDAAKNGTLGFQKIFYISLPQRTDRQDAMSLLAASTNLEMTYIPGVQGDSITEKARPKDSGSLRPEQLGCWRAHANTWRRIVDENIETALIMEDDADWDVHVHESFQLLSNQLRKGKLRKDSLSDHEVKSAPYGLDWDVLHIGACIDIPNSENRPAHQVYSDEFAPNRAELNNHFIWNLEGWGLNVSNSTRSRVIAPSWYSVCTLGYAVTRRGAQKLLYTIGGLEHLGSPLDLDMTDRVQRGLLKAYTVTPPLINMWKMGGAGDSDIDVHLKEKMEKGEVALGSENLQMSARKALKLSMMGP